MNSFKLIHLANITGDKVSVSIDLFFSQIIYRVSGRLVRVEAPRDEEGRVKFENYVKEKISAARDKKIVLYENNKEIRSNPTFLIDIFLDGKNLNKDLLDTKIGVSFRRKKYVKKPK